MRGSGSRFVTPLTDRRSMSIFTAGAGPEPPFISHPRAISEFLLPASVQTHEVIAVSDKILAISQQSNSSLLKVVLNPASGAPISAKRFTVISVNAGLHGLCPSTQPKGPGLIWATLQFDNALLLIDMKEADPNVPPVILRRINIPAPARGPHGLIQYGEFLWATCKDSSHVVRINAVTEEAMVYSAMPKPIFAAKHSKSPSGDMYFSQDMSSMILRLKTDGERSQTSVAESHSAIPVGLINGLDGNIWFVLLGGNTGGTGCFGKIEADGKIKYFNLRGSIGKKAGLLHLAFNSSSNENAVYLLSTSIASPDSSNAVFKVTFNETWDHILSEEAIVLPTQYSKAHRVIATKTSLYVTELATSTLAHIPLASFGSRDIDEASDSYSLWGRGIGAGNVEYPLMSSKL